MAHRGTLFHAYRLPRLPLVRVPADNPLHNGVDDDERHHGRAEEDHIEAGVHTRILPVENKEKAKDFTRGRVVIMMG